MNGAVKRNFKPYIHVQRYTDQNENFEYGHPHSYVRFIFYNQNKIFAGKHCLRVTLNLYVAQSQATLLMRVYRRIKCRKLLTLANQTSHYMRRCLVTCKKITNLSLLHALALQSFCYVQDMYTQNQVHSAVSEVYPHKFLTHMFISKY